MDKRSFERISVGEEIRISHENLIFSGTILNLSEKGMFIGTRKRFPLNVISVIMMRLKDKLLQIPIKIKRAAKPSGYYDGIGVELLSTPQDYLDFIKIWKKS